MLTEQDYLARAVNDRHEWGKLQAEAYKKIVEMLVPLGVVDFEHQRWVRGCGEDTSYREVRENFERFFESLDMDVNNAVYVAIQDKKEGR